MYPISERKRETLRRIKESAKKNHKGWEKQEGESSAGRLFRFLNECLTDFYIMSKETRKTRN